MTLGDATDPARDRVTAVAYDGVSNTVSQTAYNGSASEATQMTEYLFEDPVAANVASRS